MRYGMTSPNVAFEETNGKESKGWMRAALRTCTGRMSPGSSYNRSGSRGHAGRRLGAGPAPTGRDLPKSICDGGR